uniref:Cilia- and flagella-associated protein 36 n=1 Tax=Chromera velia CCMP2878 TaxID=1169474 RepID=A0A0G4GLS6_9ALVE|eukprot:Cvel_4873.t1-p1 / transcript=Cvel_4873.t1 / gene=Cvel_4873 / organism=Chromera_velia_CCMP2878 / gene_product=Coiled-coil domain-containing protein 104, putative / transcript_product=Coiled-coil domain-containing protein 104, putative / location=Cvel_scaffold220:8207-10869(+) / protein_length=110 / sequence_SO=supercontig / SO=protein_coding / is_pseudo=false
MVQNYVFNDALLQDAITFADKHCDIFEDTPEQKLEYTTVYNDFKQLFETKVETYLSEKGVTMEQFEEVLTKHKDDENSKMVVELLWACASYEMFVSLMVERKADKLTGKA